MRGLAVRWEKGERKTVEGKNHKGQVVQRMGKNGGPVILQMVWKVLTPKDGRGL